MPRWRIRRLAALALCAGSLAGVAAAQPEVIVGRADADTSGGWPVALWVIDGNHSYVTVRAPRDQLGPLRWRRADAGALMRLERFGAPKLRQQPEPDPCPSETNGDVAVDPLVAHHPGERLELAHADCAADVGCKGSAWRVDLPADPPDLPWGAPAARLPLARLLPTLAATRPQWLVLYVVSPAEFLKVSEVAQLNAAEAMRGRRSQRAWSQLRLPAGAAAQFPAIHQALLEQAASDQGLDQRSVLMRSDAVSRVRPARLTGGWEVKDPERRALGLDSERVAGHHIVRLLLRLMPADRPKALGLESGSEGFARMESLQLRTETLDSCRSKLFALNCEAGCGSRPADAALQERLEQLAERQRQAWRWIEAMTGRPASVWEGEGR